MRHTLIAMSVTGLLLSMAALQWLGVQKRSGEADDDSTDVGAGDDDDSGRFNNLPMAPKK